MTELDKSIPKIDIGIYTFFAPPKQGKTHAIKCLIKKNLHQFDDIYIFSTTAVFNGDYDFMPKSKLRKDFDDRTLNVIMDAQAANRDRKLILVFDDMIGKMEWTKKMDEFLMAHRHYNVCLLFSTQYPKKIPTIFRECMSGAFVFHIFTRTSQKALHEILFGHMKFREFQQFLSQHTGNFKYIYVHPFEVDISKRYEFRIMPSKTNLKIKLKK